LIRGADAGRSGSIARPGLALGFSIAGCGCALLAFADVLRPGAQVVDCDSALRIGTSRCAQLAATEAIPPPLPTTTTNEPPVSAAPPAHPAAPPPAPEAAVDEFLAVYGKPSREAARALIDPTDENIAAMVRKEDERIAIAAYVGRRMTELRARRPAEATPEIDSSALPAMIQMQAFLVAATGDPDGVAAAHRLDQLAAAFASLDARLIWVGDLAPRAAAIEAAADAIALPVNVVAPDLLDASEPYLLLHDSRHRLSRRLAARGLTVEQIRTAIVALRAEGQKRGEQRGEHGDASPPEAAGATTGN
jgi:hypothetical protein